MSLNIKYVCSNGTSFDLMASHMRVKSGNFHQRAWVPQVTSNQYGESVDYFTRKAVTYNLRLILRGDLDERKKQLDKLHDAFDYDIAHQTPGAIWCNDYYIKCYVITSTSAPSVDSIFWTDDTFDVYCPYPFWIEEQRIQFFANSIIDFENKGKVYPYTYTYQYGASAGNKTIIIDHYTSSDFRLIAYGPFSPFHMDIGGNVYEIDYAVASDEYLVLDTRDSQLPDEVAYIVTKSGEKINVFDFRNPAYSIKAKIQSGRIEINYPGTYGVDLTIFKERSEPRWI